GQKVHLSPVHQLAEKYEWPTFTPINFKNLTDIEVFESHKADVAVVAAYGLLLPQALLSLPIFGCLNIHASLLPRWRGAAPISRAIMAGDSRTGVCIMDMDEGLDTGPVRYCSALDIRINETSAQLHDRLAVLGAEAIVKVLADLSSYPIVKQDTIGACYAKKIDKLESRIDWSKPNSEVDRQIRGLSPFPGAWCMVGERRLKALSSSLGNGFGYPGEVLGGTEIACGTGSVTLLEVQLSGKTSQSSAEFLLGNSLPNRLD
ncbi:MAG: methionyl-tRNA formyltransferase, partial [Planktomarina sp.]|nr:methionyl-tRNA formyltransferase [Planktomarina sp.]